jgi:hypothetical protein
MPMPKPKGRSNQSWRTPPEFLEAVMHKFGLITWDLAATAGHEVGPPGSSFTPEQNSLVQDWTEKRLGPTVWLNPPFADIRPWACKLDEECSQLSRWTLLLVPYSGGSGWWRDHVLGKGMVFGVPRMKFVGAEWIYPKDLALVAYGYGVHGVGFWDWRKEQ